MKNKTSLSTVVCILFSFILNPLFAQKNSTVTGLAFNGKSANSVKTSVLTPGGGNKPEISIGDKLSSGTKLIIPPATIIMLQTQGGRQVVKPTDPAKSMEYKVEFTSDGENHIAKGLGAQIVNTVNKTLGYNYRNTNERGTTAASKGTVFTFTDLSESKSEKATIVTNEGTINIIDQMPCTINGKPIKNNRKGGITTKSVSQTQSAGQAAFTSSNQPVEYINYTRAIAYIKNEIDMEISNSNADGEDIADDFMCLGDLYMANEQPAEAANAYKAAATYFNDLYGEDDMVTLEANISLAGAYIEAKNNAQGSALLSQSIKILEEMLSLDLEDYKYVKDTDDAESEELICDEMGGLYDYLGWAYDIAGNKAKSNEYYAKAESDCE